MTASRATSVEVTGVVCGERFTDHDRFADACSRAAAGLVSLGVGAGVSVAILMRNDIDFLVAQFAAVAAGGNFVALNWHSTAEEMAYVMQDADAAVLVTHADLLNPLRGMLPLGCKVLVVPTPPDVIAAFRLQAQACRVKDADVNWTRWWPNHAPLARDAVKHGGTLGISYTSGTTGRPKGVQREVADSAAVALLYRVADEIFGELTGVPVRVLVSAPLYHGAPNFFACRGAVRGSLSVFEPRFDAEKFLQLIERYGITHTYMVPTTMIKLLDLPERIRCKYDLSSLRRVVHSAAPCPRDVKLRLIEWLGPIVYEFYGGTECGSITLLSSEEALQKPGAVGRPLQNVVIEVCDEQGHVLPAGQVGEIFARNFNTPRFSYRNLPQKQAEIERGELVSIGDIGYVDEDGFLYLCDRKRDMVISGGVNIYPAELESILSAMPGIADCIVFGVPDPVFGEALCAHVQPKADASLSPERVIEWMRSRVARFQVPRSVVIDAALPREESGKIMKRKIRDRYWQDSGRKI